MPSKPASCPIWVSLSFRRQSPFGIPPFNWINNNYDSFGGKAPKYAIYQTDGYDGGALNSYCERYPNFIPEYPVLWLMTMWNPEFKPPFGEVVYLGDFND